MSLLNMLVLAALLFLALIALERINSETTKLINKLDAVSIDFTRISTVDQLAHERQQEAEYNEGDEDDEDARLLSTKLRRRKELAIREGGEGYQLMSEQLDMMHVEQQRMMKEVATIHKHVRATCLRASITHN